MWTPDILLYNSANENFDATFPTNIVVRSTGQCEQIPPGIFKSTCRIDITWFPFDDQVNISSSWIVASLDSLCVDMWVKIRYVDSWWKQNQFDWGWTKCGYIKLSGLEIFQLKFPYQRDYQDNGEWQLISASSMRNVEYYECCPEPYIDITVFINIRRRTLYYFSNFIGPCVLISR